MLDWILFLVKSIYISKKFKINDTVKIFLILRLNLAC